MKKGNLEALKFLFLLYLVMYVLIKVGTHIAGTFGLSS